MYSLSGLQNKAPTVRIAMMTAALSHQIHTEQITGGRLGRCGTALRWLLSGGPRRVGAVYVESPTSSSMPTDLAFLLLMRLLGRPVGVYFRDAYQLFRDVHPRTRRSQILSDWLWRITMPLLKRIATVRYAPSAGLAGALRLSDAVLLPPGTDPTLPNLGIGEPDLVAAIAQLGPTSGLDTLIEAMTIVRERRPSARLRILARSIDPDAAAGLPDWVELLPSARASLPDLLERGRVCVLSLPINAYTNLAVAVRLLDFLGFGKPIVATDTVETRALIEASGAGLVTPDTAAGLAGGILLILEDADLARRLAENSRRYACSSDATWEARARTVLETLGLANEAIAGGEESAPTSRPIMSEVIKDHRGSVQAGLSIAFLGDPDSVHLRRWAAYFAGLGHKISFLVPEGREIGPGLSDQILVKRFVPFNHRRSRLLGSMDARRSLRAVLAALDPDVLHVHYVTVNAWHAWLSGFHPYAVTVWGTDVLITARQTRGRLYALPSLHGADLVTGGSETLVRAAIAAGAQPDRTRYVHFGVDTASFSPGEAHELRARLGVGEARVVLSPRIIAPNYRQTVVVEAFSRLPDDTILLMTDFLANAPEVAAVRARADALGVAKRVRIVPAVSEADVPNLYRLADVVVSVPASDGGPNTVVEALACGRPIVASDLPPNREWLAELDPEALVPVGDADATAAAIARVLDRTPQDRAERAERGRAAVLLRADKRASMAVMETLYRELAARRRGR